MRVSLPLLCHSGTILRICVVSAYEKSRFEPTVTKESYLIIDYGIQRHLQSNSNHV